ncbi:hypothetical protein HYO98_gp06 [Dinoroseobacter phage DS-1410Ws-06]|uniref:Uncharacterized protein n=1 Tax=Dinoroseobacter phage DS-1410Ws-06 TaxID=1815983 RepID=A0A191VY75_9CAUD|nr:hypothetical protein HYO98_gp06 [Dinoroseobacter phage DS-1410Ws-06]ANJ20663.1 hypothetical protein DSp06_gp06 [Dinoroseobacter phage DS-1410Ws-06]
MSDNVIYVDFGGTASNTVVPPNEIQVGPILSRINGRVVFTADKTIKEIHEIAENWGLNLPQLTYQP